MELPRCPDIECENNFRPAAWFRNEYQGFGRTTHGGQRLRCKRCRKTFSLGPTPKAARYKAPHLNPFPIGEIVNRGAIQGILRKTGESASLIYDRIDFIHRQMVAFERHRLRSLREIQRDEFSIAIDFQDFLVNWATREDRRTTQISAIASADNLSGFLFGMDLTFQPFDDPVAVFEAHRDEFQHPRPHRRTARFQQEAFFRTLLAVLEADGVAADKALKKAERSDDQAMREAALNRLQRARALFYEIQDVFVREQPQASLFDDSDQGYRPPTDGFLIDRSYLALAHVMILEQILPADARVDIYTDADGSIIKGALVAMSRRFAQDRARMGVVNIEKGLSVEKKRSEAGAAAARFKRFLEAVEAREQSLPPDQRTDFRQRRRLFIRDGMTPFRLTSWLPHGWVLPNSTVYEPRKKVVPVWPEFRPDEIDDVLLEILDYASLHAVDSFFGYVRDRDSYAQRGTRTSGTNRLWYRFAAYSPLMLQKSLDIARIHYNWVETRERRLGRFFFGEQDGERRTPAMRLGLARGPVEIKKILYENWDAHLDLAS